MPLESRSFSASFFCAGATADEPPPLGSPTDHFRDREPVGQDGLLTLTDGAQADTLNLSQLDVTPDACQDPATKTKCQPKLTNVGNFFPGNGESPVTDGSSTLATGFIEADLDAIPGSSPLRGALEPGLALSGAGATAPGCSANDFCTVWKRTTYDGSHHFSGFGSAIGVQMNDDPAANTEVAIVAGTFDPQVGPSLAVAWVSDFGGALSLKVANVVAQRDSGGQVQSLQIAGQVQDLGAVRTDPALGRTSPSLAVGDFSGNGTDQLGVAWAPGSSTLAAPKVSAAILGGSNGGGFEVKNGPTLAAPSASAIAQLSPGAVAISDMSGKPIDRLLVAPGLNLGASAESEDLRRFSPSAGGALQVSRVAQSGSAFDSRHSDLQSVGDLDGDGIDEMVSTLDPRISPDPGNPVTPPGQSGGSGIAILSWKPNTGGYQFLSLGFPSGNAGAYQPRNDLPAQTTVLDARPTTSQRIVPRVGGKDWGAMPQIVVSRPETAGGGFWRFARDFITLDETGNMTYRNSAGQPDGFSTLQTPAAPRLGPFPFNGQAELGEPVQGAYTQVEPSVILNSPPTHFDILDGQAYDPNFCYQGNQYMVPPVCFFNSEYERETDASTEVRSESTEDWSVSAKVTTDFSILSVVDVNAEIRGGYGEKFSEDNGTTTSSNVDVTVKSLNSDKIYAIVRKYDTLEYPLYQPGSANPSGYVLAVTPHTVSKRWIDSSSPAAADIRTNHQPGNILSYPNDVTTAENPFISATSGVDSFAHDEFELSDSSDYKYALTTKRITDDKASTEKNWNIGATIGLGGKVAGVVDVKAEVSGDYKNGDLSSTTTTAGDTTKLTSTMAGIDESFGETAYVVKPFSYWTRNATLVVDYAVEPVVGAPGAPKTWWQQKYGAKPDITLNLPRLLDFEEQAGISSDAARFISPDVNVLQGTCAAARPLLEKYPAPGAPLCIQAEVENYSLRDQLAPTKVRFYDADPDVGGVEIGSVDVGPITARDSRTVELNWTPDARYAGTRPRIFAVVDADDQVSEIHESNNGGFGDYRRRATQRSPRAPPATSGERTRKVRERRLDRRSGLGSAGRSSVAGRLVPGRGWGSRGADRSRRSGQRDVHRSAHRSIPGHGLLGGRSAILAGGASLRARRRRHRRADRPEERHWCTAEWSRPVELGSARRHRRWSRRDLSHPRVSRAGRVVPPGARRDDRDVTASAGVEDHGAGMSAAWLDYDGDGRLDIYTGNIWTANGQRVTAEPGFMPDAPPGAQGPLPPAHARQLALQEPRRRHLRGRDARRERRDGTLGLELRCARFRLRRLARLLRRERHVHARAGARGLGRVLLEAGRGPLAGDARRRHALRRRLARHQPPARRQVAGEPPAQRVPAQRRPGRLRRGRRQPRTRPRPGRPLVRRARHRRRWGARPRGDGGAAGAAAAPVPERVQGSARGPRRPPARHEEQPRRRGGARHGRNGQDEAVRVVQAGSGFISQHSKELLFGLGEARRSRSSRFAGRAARRRC